MRDASNVRGGFTTCQILPGCGGAKVGPDGGCYWHSTDPNIVRRRTITKERLRALGRERKGKTHEEFLQSRTKGDT